MRHDATGTNLVPDRRGEMGLSVSVASAAVALEQQGCHRPVHLQSLPLQRKNNLERHLDGACGGMVIQTQGSKDISPLRQAFYRRGLCQHGTRDGPRVQQQMHHPMFSSLTSGVLAIPPLAGRELALLCVLLARKAFLPPQSLLEQECYAHT